MGKKQTNFTLSEQTLRKFKEEVPDGQRSQVVNKLVDNYVGKPAEGTSEKREKLQEVQNEQIEVEEEIQDLKSQLAQLRNEESALRESIKQEEKAEKQKQKVSDFVGHMVEKFERSDYKKPEDWFSDYGSGNREKLKNTQGVDLDMDELRQKFYDSVEGETE